MVHASTYCVLQSAIIFCSTLASSFSPQWEKRMSWAVDCASRYRLQGKADMRFFKRDAMGLNLAHRDPGARLSKDPRPAQISDCGEQVGRTTTSCSPSRHVSVGSAPQNSEQPGISPHTNDDDRRRTSDTKTFRVVRSRGAHKHAVVPR